MATKSQWYICYDRAAIKTIGPSTRLARTEAEKKAIGKADENDDEMMKPEEMEKINVEQPGIHTGMSSTLTTNVD